MVELNSCFPTIFPTDTKLPSKRYLVRADPCVRPFWGRTPRCAPTMPLPYLVDGNLEPLKKTRLLILFSLAARDGRPTALILLVGRASVPAIKVFIVTLQRSQVAISKLSLAAPASRLCA